MPSVGTSGPTAPSGSRAGAEQQRSSGAAAGNSREEMFQRIMRKLQHQAHYSDNTQTLTQQALGGGQLVPSREAATPQPPQEQKAPQDASGEPHPRKLQAGVRVSESRSDGGSSGKAEEGSLSEPAAPRSAILNISSTKDLDEEEERKFGLQPCPPTLRTVVGYVRESIEEKLELAHIGSLWEAMKCIFESRTMLDKLLKEVAQHTHFQEVGNDNATTAGAATRIHEMYQELRKVPVVLPQAHYVQDNSGRFVAGLKAQGDSTSGPVKGGNSSFLPQPPRSPLPATQSITQRTTSPLVAASNAAARFRQGSQPPQSSVVSQHPEMFVHTVMAAKDKRDHELLMKHLRRKTQWMEVGVQTEENALNIILKEQYTTLGKHCGELEMQLENKKGDIKVLTKKLHDAKQLLGQKTRVVEYLRGTLFKETVLLRQQLAAAHQRHVMMQQQQQLLSQQMMSQVSSIGSGGGGGGGGPSFSQSVTAQQQFTTTTSASVVEDFDITAISSVIDLALLGVEKNRSMNRTTDEMVKIAATSGGLLSDIPSSSTNDPLLTPNTDVQISRLREELQVRTMKWKRELAGMRSKFAIVVNEKNKQIKSIQLATDMKNLRSILLSQVGSIQQDYTHMRKMVRETLASMRNNLLSNLAEVEYSLKLISDAVDISTEKSKTVSCQTELIRACRELFIPMMTAEYAIGSHRWLQRHRPGDPLLHALQMKANPDVISAIAPELESMHLVYQTLQKFVIRHYQVPQIAHPQPGAILVQLIQMLLGDVNCTQDLTVQLRTCLQIEHDLCRKIAKLNFKVKVTTAKQATAQEVAVKALREMGVDTNASASGPTQKVINRLVMHVTMLQTMRADAQRQRLSNAKEVHRLWRESAMDPFRGRRPPKVREVILQNINAAPLAATTAATKDKDAAMAPAEQRQQQRRGAREQRGDSQAPAPSFS